MYIHSEVEKIIIQTITREYSIYRECERVVRSIVLARAVRGFPCPNPHRHPLFRAIFNADSVCVYLVPPNLMPDRLRLCRLLCTSVKDVIIHTYTWKRTESDRIDAEVCINKEHTHIQIHERVFIRKRERKRIPREKYTTKTNRLVRHHGGIWSDCTRKEKNDRKERERKMLTVETFICCRRTM